MEITGRSTVVASRNHLSSKLGEETVILQMDDGIYFGLDEIGSRVWSLIQEARAVAEVCRTLTGEYDVTASECEAAVIALLREMLDAGLIRIQDQAPTS